MNLRAVLSGFGLCMLTVGCGGDAEGKTGSELDPSQALVAKERLQGRYAHYDVVAYQSTVIKTLIISYGFTDLTLKDGALIATESFCFSEHRSDQPIMTEMSDEATQAIKPPSIEVEMSEMDGQVYLWRPATPTALGIELENPETDALPKDPKDAKAVDADGDGKPGVTVKIKVSEDFMGELYIARREIFAYGVTEQSDGSLVGEVTDNSEQLILGASNDVFLMSAEWLQVPDLSKSPIILKPVSADWDCARLKAERPELFPPTPMVDW